MEWFELHNPDEIESPSLIVDGDRVVSNIKRMLEFVDGDASRLRPHVKTHKMPDVIKLQLDAGINQFKTSTIAETEMVAAAGAASVLLAHQPVGGKIDRLFDLVKKYPATSFAAIVDDASIAEQIEKRVREGYTPFPLYIDVDCGMQRTGVPLGAKVESLIQEVSALSGVVVEGLHVYDGHIHQPDLADRQQAAEQIIAELRSFTNVYLDLKVIGGGSPTFAFWAQQSDWQCSPGTPILWDVGYGRDYPDLDFEIAAALLTRVISKPGAGCICLDLGHKAVSSEMPLADRVILPAIPDAKLISHSEEHLVVETSTANDVSVGDAFLAFPRHICPSVADYAQATVVRSGKSTGEAWPITARR